MVGNHLVSAVLFYLSVRWIKKAWYFSFIPWYSGSFRWYLIYQKIYSIANLCVEFEYELVKNLNFRSWEARVLCFSGVQTRVWASCSQVCLILVRWLRYLGCYHFACDMRGMWFYLWGVIGYRIGTLLGSFLQHTAYGYMVKAFL